jgi:NTP pyrophosphatase (non-canonical NTP hydrolase)
MAMTPNEYQKAALRTLNTKELDLNVLFEKVRTHATLINGLVGLNGEAGEALDIVKKYLFHNHELDKEHLAKELGDVAWYLAISADGLGYTLEQIMEMNVAKLKERYPDGFTTEQSKHRKAGDI